jgi:hypothetical protein
VTLDIAQIAQDLRDLVGSVDPDRERERFSALRSAWSALDTSDINERLETAKTSFLLARSENDYRYSYPLPAVPRNYTVAATDGSMIAPDRHSPARFYLINVGKVLLRYGDTPGASLTNEHEFRFEEKDLYVPDAVHRQPVNETILGLRRAAKELTTASSMIDGDAPEPVALVDGTLILWMLSSQEQPIREWALGEYLEALSILRERRLPVAGYISAPGSSELMNILRVSICDYPAQGRSINCDHCRRRILTENRTPACDILPMVTDRWLLHEIAGLRPGERTEIYESESKILDEYGDDLRICFFYVNSGREVGRVEIPRWVAHDPDLLDRVHAVIFDQCARGRGYPVALQEAHELAVLSMGDRRLIEEVIERNLASIGIVRTRTGKDGSKRDRFV